MDINEARDFLENRINPNMVGTVLRAAEEEGEKHALPSGGEVGDVLKKTTDGAEWAEETKELPSGGNANDVLTKTASGIEWKAPSGGGGEPDYSTTEVDTGVKWVDGKTIYKKSLEAEAHFTVQSTEQVMMVFSIPSVDRIMKIDGMVGDYANQYYPLNTYIGANHYFIARGGFRGGNRDVVVDYKVPDEVFGRIWITVYYTKN